MKPERLAKDQIQSLVKDAVDRAVSFIEADVIDDLNKALRYYNGEVDTGAEAGRSKVIATKCRDVVNALKPPLLRAFLAADKPVEFVPNRVDAVAAAEQATEYVKWIFEQSDGYRVVSGAIHDALVQRVGVVKVYHDEKEETEIDFYSGLTEEEFALVANDPEVEILEASQGETGLFDAKVSRTRRKGCMRIDPIAPEDFFVDPDATTLDDAEVCGHRDGEFRVGDLVAMGYDFAEIIEHAGEEETGVQREQDYTRDDNAEQWGEASRDQSMRKVLLTECYMRMDIEGAGVPQLYRFVLIGNDYHVLDYDLADEKPFAVFQVEPEPHTFHGKSVVEMIMADQDAATAMLRGLLDNVALVNNPGFVVDDEVTNLDDLLNNEIGRLVRSRDPGSVVPLVVPPIAASTLPILQYFDESIENKTGVSRASMGLDPDILQNTTAAAVNAMTAAATGRVEMYARNLAEGGMKRLFRLLLKLVKQHADPQTMMRVNGSFVPADPRSWAVDMDMVANVGLGSGGEVEREMVLREVLGHQMSVWQAYGPGNPLVSLTNIRNTLADVMKLGGVHNADRYFMPMDPQREQMMLQQMASQSQQGTDPNAAFLQVEAMKAQQKAQTDAARLQLDSQKAMAEEQRRRAEVVAKDDLQRDKMAQDLAVRVAELAGKQVNEAQVRAEQAAPRRPVV